MLKESMGRTPEGVEVDQYTLENARGMRVKVMTYGATLIAVETPDRDGRVQNITLALDSLDAYLQGHPFLGSTVGRFANRISKAQFRIGDRTYRLAANLGPDHLHGGIKGFDKAVWRAEPVETPNSVGVAMTHTSPDGDEGYPGTMNVTVVYSLTENNELRMEYSAVCDKPTVVNLTNHAYWNLFDGGASDILGHELTIHSDQILAVDDKTIPTGELMMVEGTAWDFRQPKTIGSRIAETGDGYDHCYVLRHPEDGRAGTVPISAGANPQGWSAEVGLSPLTPMLIARVVEPRSGRFMEVFTTEPGVQFYTGNYLDVSHGGRNYRKHFGFCLETQHYPDSPNQPSFPSTLLNPGQRYEQLTVHRFGVVEG